MVDIDRHIDRLDSHITKLFDRLDSAYVDINLKDYINALATARALVLGLIAMQKGLPDDDAGAAVRKFATAFKDATRRGPDDSGPDADPDLAALTRQLADTPAATGGDANGSGG
jgi:hypothetical protein